MEGNKFFLGFDNYLAEDSTGRSGGLALLWNKEMDISIKSFSKYHFHAYIALPMNMGDGWFITGLYDHPKFQHLHITWDLLNSLKVSGNEVWLVGGDLNEIMDTIEKWGGNP